MTATPIFSRKYLRQTLGRNHLRDTYVGTSLLTLSTGNTVQVLDALLADVSLSGQNLYQGVFLRVGTYDYRVASFNVASGALVSGQVLQQNLGAPVEFERHDVLPPVDKDRAIDETVKRLWTRAEVAIDTVERAHVYPLPDGVIDVLDAYYVASPFATLGRDQRRLTRFETVTTQTGVELRIDPALMASQQIVLDAITSVSLGTADYATVSVPDERLVLFGAEAQCWDLMVRKAPRGTADEYRALRNEAARQFNLLSARFKTPVDRPLRLDSPTGRVF